MSDPNAPSNDVNAPSNLDIGAIFEDFIAAVHQLENALAGTRLIFADTDLSVGDWVVLRNIPPDEDMRFGLLARRTGLSRQRLDKLLEGLSEIGLVQVREETGDKRLRLVNLSAAGARELEAISKVMRGAAQKTVGNTRPELLQRFAVVARQIVNTMSPKPQASSSGAEGSGAEGSGAEGAGAEASGAEASMPISDPSGSI